METNPINIGRNVWAYPSRSGKTLEFYVRKQDVPTLTFRISFAKLKLIQQAVKRG